MFPHFNPMNYSLNHLNSMYNNLLPKSSGPETTSIDGKPILTPFQIAHMSSLQLQSLFYSQFQNTLMASMQNKLDLLRPLTSPNTTNLGKRSFDNLSKQSVIKDYEPSKPQKKVKGDCFDLKFGLNNNYKNNLVLFDSHLPTAENSNSSVQNSPIIISPKEFKETVFVNRKSDNKEKVITKSTKKMKIIKVVFEEGPGKMMFQVKVIENGNKKFVFMTKEEILQEDPLILVYFYERNLHFNGASDFDQMRLKRLEE